MSAGRLLVNTRSYQRSSRRISSEHVPLRADRGLHSSPMPLVASFQKTSLACLECCPRHCYNRGGPVGKTFHQDCFTRRHKVGGWCWCRSEAGRSLQVSHRGLFFNPLVSMGNFKEGGIIYAKPIRFPKCGGCKTSEQNHSYYFSDFFKHLSGESVPIGL